MRKRPNQDVIAARIAKRYHRLHDPIVELVQCLQDSIPQGMELGDRVVLEQKDGQIQIICKMRPIEIVIVDGNNEYSLRMQSTRRS